MAKNAKNAPAGKTPQMAGPPAPSEQGSAAEAAQREAERIEAERQAADDAARVEEQRRAGAEAERVHSAQAAAAEAARIAFEQAEVDRMVVETTPQLAMEQAANAEADRIAAEAPLLVRARVLCLCEHGNCNDVVELDAALIAELAGVVDADPAAVAYAESLKKA